MQHYIILQKCVMILISHFADDFKRILGATETVLSDKGKILATLDICKYQPVGCGHDQ
jgi:hypothetical protein